MRFVQTSQGGRGRLSAHRLPKSVWQFQEDILVECPRCQGCAMVKSGTPRMPGKGTLTCSACGLISNESRATPYFSYHYHDGSDPFLGHPLWLRENVGGKVLWAFNWAHLDDLEFFIEGDWRAHRHLAGESRSTHSYRPRYPQWMYLARNRNDILRAIRRLRKRRG